MNIKSLGLMANPLIAMIKNVVPQEDPSNSSAVFVKDIVDVFVPESEDSLMNEVEGMITNMAIIAVNRDPDAFKEKLAILETKIQRFFEKER